MGVIICILSVLVIGLGILCYRLSHAKAEEDKQVAYENEQNLILLEKLRQQIETQRAEEAELAQNIASHRRQSADLVQAIMDQRQLQAELAQSITERKQQEAGLSAQIDERHRTLNALAAQEKELLRQLEEHNGRQLVLETKIEEKNKSLSELDVRDNELVAKIEEHKTQDRELGARIGEENKTLSALTERKKQLNSAIDEMQDQKNILDQNILNSQEISRNAFENYHKQLEQSYQAADEEYKNEVQKYRDEMEKEKSKIAEEIETIKGELNKIKETRAAILEAQRREELLKQEKDTFRVVLTEEEVDTIAELNKIKAKLPEPRILSMLIWQSFYQKKLKALTTKILGNKTVCGIYKITNLKNDMCYIGQAKTMDTRWSEHMKCGLGIDAPVGNKLYQAMREIGPENFTFELLEECPAARLNEREKFYIDYYQSYAYGYNSNRGIG